MIICETFSHQDRAADYYWRDTSGKTPICRALYVGDMWELTWFRGPTRAGPYRYASIERLRMHVRRYLRHRGDRLAGEPHTPVSGPDGYDRMPPSDRDAMGRQFAPLKVTPRRPRRRW